jgi:nitrate/nitrite transporter NarK
VLLNLASIIERADEQVLPAVYHFISLSFHCSPSELGTLTLCRAMVQALSSPLSGVLGDKYDRTHIVAFGCFLCEHHSIFLFLSLYIFWGSYDTACWYEFEMRQNVTGGTMAGCKHEHFPDS